ncbi:hypothetical protein JQC79_05845 [Ochrobactrum anthropi]|uniref:hypothetical protein n=1 Tax=Brucella anthropi TaxID=529 RepID=UPI001951391B|nr:hypothetical protein [Brucella anthropi]MBM6395278.1 hypothetical protein [Brucella anthropi]
MRNRIFGTKAPESKQDSAASQPVETEDVRRAVEAASSVSVSQETAKTDPALDVPKVRVPKSAKTTAPKQGSPVARASTKRAVREVSTKATKTGGKQQDPIQARSLRPVAINLGIDFGTSFTKVCYRDVGTEESGVVAVGTADALLDSVVIVSRTGKLYLNDVAKSLKAPVRVPYLKMRLAGVPIGDSLPSVQGVELGSEAATKALAAWFLASVIARSQSWIATNQADRLKGRTAIWSANVGVPVEHYDSPILKTFEEVLGIAWLWVRNETIPENLQEALDAYAAGVGQLDKEVSDFHAVAEIAAAVQSFVMSREAQEGIYVYFDIGGGTVDGVAFNYLNWSGDRRINFYAGKVASLGLAAIAAAIDSHHGDVDAKSFERLMTACAPATNHEMVIKIRKLVGEVVMTAKFKDGRNWQVDAIQNMDYQRKFVGPLSTSRMRPLIVFLGGGGSKSTWYAEAISSTYKAFQHHNAGIPPYKILQVPVPKDFSMTGAEGHDFNRYAISYGLSVPFGEGPEVGLPSEFTIAERPKVRQLAGVVDYSDSKDVFG